ncbi:tropomyosin [Tripterygium wilfordii]|uniref:Tropomyosin n=2 Tax=Tripterygium wilfordii TaxID=458696 RepID=A0A7J7CE85_TRIWF|nr:peroxisomal and mitochondrial division factor 1-like isoform X1 [Tripterygium wilfordii]XP_038682467.1 peroxisomal and mitochondrial division factor 1-like isoform X1 [Tripterygium wilfordii]XP_038682468.1 peroxisomal and mitochondrial division factor 1-like isoform X1 [Tripterygium wilfordii]XP_038682469.1 peroxisomal and mitochondrial division factor 1-like isoform X1 [Tripterygium wilfordii]XP_038682470.1 peroxisomal and mitochondrial division factor 1-like isoform X1 [Tripterygium wilfor
MAEKTINNGVASDAEDQAAENFYDINDTNNGDTKVSEMTRKIEALENEKLRLVRDNGEIKDQITNLTSEIEGLSTENEQLRNRLGELEGQVAESEQGKRALESIAARAVDLETEVSRLQHDLISAMSDGEEANSELAELKKVLGEKESKLEGLESEVESLKKANAESEKKVRELERKIGILEVKEIEEKSKKIRGEEEMREKIKEKESEISGFKKKIEDLEYGVAQNGVELEKITVDKKVLEEALRESEEKVKAMELKMVELQSEAEEAGKVISGLKESTIQAVNGTASEILENGEGGEKGYKGLKVQWPVVALGSTGAIAATAAVLYVCYARRR